MPPQLYIAPYIIPGSIMSYFTPMVFFQCVYVLLRYIYPIGVQKGGPSYSPAIVVYTLHSIVMVLLYYIYLLGTYHWLLSLILSVHFRNLMLI